MLFVLGQAKHIGDSRNNIAGGENASGKNNQASNYQRSHVSNSGR